MKAVVLEYEYEKTRALRASRLAAGHPATIVAATALKASAGSSVAVEPPSKASASTSVETMSNGGIIYALVARGTCVLAEFTTTSGNFTTVTRRILEKIPREDAKMSYVYDSHVFHLSLIHI